MTRDTAFRGGIVVALIATATISAWASRSSAAPVASPPATAIPAAVASSDVPGARVSPTASRTIVRPTTEAPVPTATAMLRPVRDEVAQRQSSPARRTDPGSTPGLVAHSGIASWYCEPGRSICTADYPADCLCAAASATLRAALGAGWRGARIRVSRGAAAVYVALVDTCGCPGGRLVDLYAAAFGRLAPLGAGVARVEVGW